MDIIKKHLNYIGLVLILAALIALRIWPHLKTVPVIFLILGAAAIGLYMYLNLSLLKQGFKRKSFLYSSNLLLLVVFVLGILVLVNVFLARHHHRFDFTETRIHSLSDQTVTVLENLEEDISVHLFFREGNMTRGRMENLIQNYRYHSNRIKYEFIDPDKNPGLVKRYDVKQDGTTIFESGEKDNRITDVSEEEITNALIKISRGEKKTVYFLEGHGEGGIEDTEDLGYSLAKDELEKMGYEVKTLSLALSETFPGDIALLIVPGPEKDLLPNELDTIRGYISGGGRVFLMIDPETAPGMTEFVKEYGIGLTNDLVIDTVSRLLGGDYFMPVVNEYTSHPITEKFRYATFFPYARSIEALEDQPEGVTVEVLANSSGNSWSERQLTEKQVKFDEGLDKAGPVGLAAVVTIESKPKGDSAMPEGEEGTETSEAPASKEGRLAVFGDSDFIANNYYNLSGNGNFFLNTANWLTEEEDLIAIQPKTQTPRTIQLTPSQGRLIFFTSVLILPLLVLVTGLVVWVRRRKL